MNSGEGSRSRSPWGHPPPRPPNMPGYGCVYSYGSGSGPYHFQSQFPHGQPQQSHLFFPQQQQQQQTTMNQQLQQWQQHDFVNVPMKIPTIINGHVVASSSTNPNPAFVLGQGQGQGSSNNNNNIIEEKKTESNANTKTEHKEKSVVVRLYTGTVTMVWDYLGMVGPEIVYDKSKVIGDQPVVGDWVKVKAVVSEGNMPWNWVCKTVQIVEKTDEQIDEYINPTDMDSGIKFNARGQIVLIPPPPPGSIFKDDHEYQSESESEPRTSRKRKHKSRHHDNRERRRGEKKRKSKRKHQKKHKIHKRKKSGVSVSVSPSGGQEERKSKSRSRNSPEGDEYGDNRKFLEFSVLKYHIINDLYKDKQEDPVPVTTQNENDFSDFFGPAKVLKENKGQTTVKCSKSKSQDLNAIPPSVEPDNNNSQLPMPTDTQPELSELEKFIKRAKLVEFERQQRQPQAAASTFDSEQNPRPRPRKKSRWDT